VRPLTNEQTAMRPGGVASVAYHLRHLAGSIDRLLTYAAGRQLDADQRRALDQEREHGHEPGDPEELLAIAVSAIGRALEAVRDAREASLYEPREVGRSKLPSNVIGLLGHIAEHTTRHTGQVVTTALLVAAPQAPRSPSV
jgi:uncharacterized damage-inducible protein DinB